VRVTENKPIGISGIAIAPTIPATLTTCISPAIAPEARRRAQSPGSPVAKQTAGAAIPASKTFTAARPELRLRGS
jgi:hypothetical protein